MTAREDSISPIRVMAVGIICLAGLFVFTSCQRPFDVNVNAEDPIKIDLAMDVNVYHHGNNNSSTNKKQDQAFAASGAGSAEYRLVLERRRNRMAEIQTLKNNRFVGENHQGLLELRAIPDGDYGAYVKKTVKEENADRNYLIEHEALTRNKDIEEIRAEQWNHQQRKSHPGEWIEVANPERPGNYIWKQKTTPGTDED